MSLASTLAPAAVVTAAPTAAASAMAPRTRAMLEGAIIPVLLRLAAPTSP